ncbi:MAG: cytidine deaminase [Thiotrichales bacterium]|nr:MAG: cytidine deaminase [Thiotrichales bacterium]
MKQEILNNMHQRAIQVLQHSYAPYSKLHVGACVLSNTSQLFSGCNVENSAYGLSMCAEQNAIGNMIAAGMQKLEAVLIVSSKGYCSPCGACLQVLVEFASKDAQIYLATTEAIIKTFTVSELLPNSFNKSCLH